MPLTAIGAGLIGAGIGAAGSVGSSAVSAASAAKNRAWQERMDNTKYQRSITDMRAAGLNPMMMYSGKTNVSSMSAPSMPQINDAGAAMSRGFSTGLQARRAQDELNILEQNVRKQKAEADMIESDSKLKQMRNDLETKHTEIDMKNVDRDAVLRRSKGQGGIMGPVGAMGHGLGQLHDKEMAKIAKYWEKVKKEVKKLTGNSAKQNKKVEKSAPKKHKWVPKG